jgi:hypothetical protein
MDNTNGGLVVNLGGYQIELQGSFYWADGSAMLSPKGIEQLAQAIEDNLAATKNAELDAKDLVVSKLNRRSVEIQMQRDDERWMHMGGHRRLRETNRRCENFEEQTEAGTRTVIRNREVTQHSEVTGE